MDKSLLNPNYFLDIMQRDEIRFGVGKSRRGWLLDIIAFVIPLTKFIEINAIGRLFGPDILLALLFPVLVVLRGRKLCREEPRIFLFLAAIWLLGQVITDIRQDTELEDYARGWSMIIFTMLNFSAIFLLLDGYPHRIFLYAIGLSCGGIIKYFVNPSDYGLGFPWKFGYGTSVTWLLLLLAVVIESRKRGRSYAATGLVFFASGLNFVLDFRSLGGICFLTAIYLTVRKNQVKRRSNIKQMRRWQVVMLVVIGGVAGWGVLELYGRAAESGILGDDMQRKYVMQAGGSYGLLIGGRSEVLASGQAIMDSPILGHGSWAKDCSYAELFIERKRELGYGAGEVNEKCLIPTHSHLFGAWVQAGFLGALFWLYVLRLGTKALFSLYPLRDPMTPILVFFTILLIWDVLFSPYGADRRFVVPFYVISIMVYTKNIRGSDKKYNLTKRGKGGGQVSSSRGV